MKSVEELRALADRIAGAGGKRIAVTPASAHVVAHALRVYADQISRPIEDHASFTVDVWSEAESIIETMARCSSLLVGRAAFEQAVKERPALKVTLRQGIRIVATSEERAR